ncbi:MAG: DUF2150 family protein [Archaeoglobaceae archaeon]|nr:DUF2150 family protein [Archaeoglobaceae archaeon]MDW7989361.1 DUF2150 family protein [Archaeoglobaceae archaeon]
MEFYNEIRLQNWIKKINEIRVSEEDPSTLIVFDQMLEDVIIACFSILNAIKEREIKKSEALKEIEKIKNIFNKNYKFNSDLKEDLFFLTLESVKAVLASFEYYIEGKFSKKDIKGLINDAIENERKGRRDIAFDAVARIGAKVIRGEKLPELNIPEDDAILSWIDGIDAISMIVELSKIDSSQIGDEAEE